MKGNPNIEEVDNPNKYVLARTPDMKSRYHKLCSLRKNKS